jgi:hypothetical protein
MVPFRDIKLLRHNGGIREVMIRADLLDAFRALKVEMEISDEA